MKQPAEAATPRVAAVALARVEFAQVAIVLIQQRQQRQRERQAPSSACCGRCNTTLKNDLNKSIYR